MTIEQLRYFCIVAEQKNISHAAEILYISPSALSRHISALEEGLNVKLFIRSVNSIELTKAGEYVFEKAPQVIKIFDNFESSIQQINRNTISSIIIGCPLLYNAELFSLFEKFRIKNPDTAFMLNPLESWEVKNAVETGENDCGITFDYELDPDDSKFDFSLIFKEHFSVLMKKNHPLAIKKSLTLDDIKNETLLLPTRPSDPRGPFFNKLKELGIKPRKAFESPVKAAFQVRAGNGMAIYPTSVCKEFQEGCTIVPFNDETFDTRMVLFWRADENKEPVIEFINFIRASVDHAQI